ncbi:Piso0_001338 [Millerozyma farinosa CBS 7064]|uniref:Piso0_001338 protein n=1 Tax=Pichia sorbitophila (strain ATCC MYA-4447 / BCRC 22081 / CBS 7064 / NBRC 10061 / NRRL Y-12695) TaxID=559304 RepID=G8YMH3_PICSO|nr:Piso0_001338 [Millerozyma farinosa CBS 7064]
MSSKVGSSSKKKNAPPENHDTAEKKKIKMPKNFIVRPSISTSAKSSNKVYVNKDIIEGLEVVNGSLIHISKLDKSNAGVLGTIHGVDEIEDKNIVGLSQSTIKLGGLLLGDRVELKKISYNPPQAEKVCVNICQSSAKDDESRDGSDFLKDSKIERALTKVFDEVGILHPGQTIFGICVNNDAENSKDSYNVTILDVSDSSSIEDEFAQMKINEDSNASKSSSTMSLDVVSPPHIFVKGKSTLTEISNIDLPYIKYNRLPRNLSFSDLGGLAKQVKTLRLAIDLPLNNPKLFSEFGISPPRGILLQGPPGTGKTMLLRCIAYEVDAHILTVSGPSIVSKYMGEAENAIRDIFLEAKRFEPSIIILDEIDSLAPSRNSEDSGEAESRVIATILTMIDSLNASNRVLIIGATNRPNSVDSSLRRPGRFDQEIEIGIPDVEARFDILQKQFRKINKAKYNLKEDEIKLIASKTHGYVGADLISLCREAIIKAVTRGLSDKTNETLMTYSDMDEALTEVRPSAMREVLLEMPKVYWSDIGGQTELKRKLVEVVQLPLEAADTFHKLGVQAPKGVLLYGPPGCSKTLTAKALATESGLNFLAVKGPEILNKYVGESERTIREIFRKARTAAPSIIFFDEIDAISSDRESASTSAAQNVLTSLLNEIDGVEELKGVIILAATNRPTEIDSALLRPGRLDRHIYVGPPDYEARLDILRKKCASFDLEEEELSFEELARWTEGCSGAEVSLLCQEAGLAAIMEDKAAQRVQKKHFEFALKGISRGITSEMLNYYKEFASRFGLEV